MNPLSMRRLDPSPRNGQLLPISAILPDVLRRYDLLTPTVESADRLHPVSSTPRFERSTTSLATVDSVPYY